MVIINIGKNITYPSFGVAFSPPAVNPSCVLSLSPNAAHNTKQCIVVCITCTEHILYYASHTQTTPLGEIARVAISLSCLGCQFALSPPHPSSGLHSMKYLYCGPFSKIVFLCQDACKRIKWGISFLYLINHYFRIILKCFNSFIHTFTNNFIHFQKLSSSN